MISKFDPTDNIRGFCRKEKTNTTYSLSVFEFQQNYVVVAKAIIKIGTLVSKNNKLWLQLFAMKS